MNEPVLPAATTVAEITAPSVDYLEAEVVCDYVQTRHGAVDQIVSLTNPEFDDAGITSTDPDADHSRPEGWCDLLYEGDLQIGFLRAHSGTEVFKRPDIDLCAPEPGDFNAIFEVAVDPDSWKGSVVVYQSGYYFENWLCAYSDDTVTGVMLSDFRRESVAVGADTERLLQEIYRAVVAG